MIWRLQPIDVNTSNAANKVASLFPALVKFYIFLQNWGIQYDEKDDKTYYKCKNPLQ